MLSQLNCPLELPPPSIVTYGTEADVIRMLGAKGDVKTYGYCHGP